VKTRTLRRPLNYKHTRRGVRLLIVFFLVFGVGYSLWGDEGVAAPAGPSASTAAWSAFYSSYGQQLREESPTAAATSCDDLSVLVDRSHTLPSDYAPGDLVPLEDYGVPTLGREALRREAAEHLGRLVKGAAAAGEDLEVTSAYRSYEEQRHSHKRSMRVFGAEAGRMSATPGHSQHQLGTAVDFTNAAAGHQVTRYFGRTSAYGWLERHAWEYGFVLAYPKGKEVQTGYRWEPWHFRYVGIEDAERLEESNLSLQEFLERAGTTPRC
jgi:D-alanyl-D-alanine carboxypeptidase